jgi:hypothetical protein
MGTSWPLRSITSLPGVIPGSVAISVTRYVPGTGVNTSVPAVMLGSGPPTVALLAEVELCAEQLVEAEVDDCKAALEVSAAEPTTFAPGAEPCGTAAASTAATGRARAATLPTTDAAVRPWC